MALLKLTSNEPLEIVELIEQLFPGTNLDAVKKAIGDVAILGDITLSKHVGKDLVSLQIQIVNK